VEKGGELNVAARFIRRVVVLLQQVTDEFTIDGEPPVFKKVDDRLVIQFKGVAQAPEYITVFHPDDLAETVGQGESGAFGAHLRESGESLAEGTLGVWTTGTQTGSAFCLNFEMSQAIVLSEELSSDSTERDLPRTFPYWE